MRPEECPSNQVENIEWPDDDEKETCKKVPVSLMVNKIASFISDTFFRGADKP